MFCRFLRPFQCYLLKLSAVRGLDSVSLRGPGETRSQAARVGIAQQ
jgi:hypothetical protein